VIQAFLPSVQGMSPSDTLLTAGLDSLVAIKLQSALMSATGRTIPMSALLEKPTLSSIHEALLRSQDAASGGVNRSARGDGTPSGVEALFTLPRRCAAAASLPIALDKTMKLGTKTALYVGRRGSQRMVVKTFHIRQYAVFYGFSVIW